VIYHESKQKRRFRRKDKEEASIQLGQQLKTHNSCIKYNYNILGYDNFATL